MTRAGVVPSFAAATATTLLVGLVLASCVPRPAGRTTPESGTPSSSTGHAATAPATPPPSLPSPTISFGRPTATPLPTFFTYRVRTGDTVTSIARQFGTTARSIGSWNRDTSPSLVPDRCRYNPNDIRVGWTLRLIPGVEVDPDELTPPPAAPSGSGDAGD